MARSCVCLERWPQSRAVGRDDPSGWSDYPGYEKALDEYVEKHGWPPPRPPTPAERTADAVEALREGLAEPESEPDTPSQQGRKLSRETERELMKRLRRRNRSPGDPRNSQRAIAEDLGISPTTVQRYWVRMRDG